MGDYESFFVRLPWTILCKSDHSVLKLEYIHVCVKNISLLGRVKREILAFLSAHPHTIFSID